MNTTSQRSVFVPGQSISWTPSEQETYTQCKALEDIIDGQGLGRVLEMIREICYGKANHIAVEWQDVVSAKLWIAYALHVNSAVQKINR